MSTRWRSRLAAMLSAALAMTLVSATEATAAPRRPDKPLRLESVPGTNFSPRSAPADAVPAVAKAPTVSWPAAGAAPSVRAAGGLTTTVLDRAAARGSGRDVVIRVNRPAGASATARAPVSVGYAGFGDAYGGDWARRLRLVALPECALSTPDKADCQGTPLATVNDPATRTLSAEVGAATSLVALVAGPSSDGGDYTATDLRASSVWTGGGSAGDFAWAYPLRTPAGLGGPTPSVALGYSAQAVDGLTAASNAQPSVIGEGFGWHPGAIDRGYRACADDGKTGVGDLCWAGDNAVLNLNGRASALIYHAASGQWRPAADDGSRVERFTDTTRANGDADGEYWKVTTTDGMQYFFGLNRLPGWRSTGPDPETNSVSYVPVFGNNAGEPCNASTFAASSCQQAYRWSLDYVVDPHGNTMSYFYQREINRYARNVVNTDTPDYVRASFVREINYGTRQDGGVDSVFAGTAPARMVVTTALRCITPGSTCVLTNPANFPDVPLDQNCAGGNCSGRYSPTFWTVNRVAEITTQVANGVKTWRDVDRWRFTHEFKDPGDGNVKILWLKQIDHCGLSGMTTCLPPVVFNPTQLSNRVDRTGATSSIIRYRMRSIASESGGLITISYSAPECAAPSNLPATPDTNTKRCFPAYWMPPGATTPKLEYFHKYVVTEVSHADLTGAAPDQVTRYTYGGTPAWHHDDSPLTLPTRRSWGQWRGYQTVTETHGANAPEQSRSTYTYFRGMHGDRLASGTRSASVPDSDGGSLTDHDWLAGLLREQITYLGTSNTVVEKTKSDPYQFGPTATVTLHGITIEGRVVSTASTTTTTVLDGGRAPRVTRQTNTFTNDRTGRLDRVDNLGDLATAADDQCTRYTYATNAAGTLVNAVARVETVGVNCAATPDRAVDVLSDVRTWYDGATSFGTTATRGLATRVEERSGWVAGNAVYATTGRSAYDGHGRIVEAVDARNHTTTTVYTPAVGGPLTRIRSTNPMGWVTVTDIDPAAGVSTKITDQNGVTSESAYDGLGRLTHVWLAGRPRTALADVTHVYNVRSSGGPTVVESKRLNPAGTAHISGFTLYDGQLRKRQTQVAAVGGGRMISETLFDSRGFVVKERPAYFNSAAPSSALFVPTGDTAVPAQTVTHYDGADRESLSVFQTQAVEKWRTTTTYGGDHTKVAPPAGAPATANWTDARGRVVKSWQYHGSTPTGTYDETTRTYTRAGDLATIRDTAGTTWRYEYDQRRRKVRDDDPDKGEAVYTYDDAGNVLTVRDARGQTLAFVYDAIGRRTATHSGSTGGPVLTRWTYDTLAKGAMTSSTRYEGANAFTTEMTSFNLRYQPLGTKVTIPASEGTLAGSYTTDLTYNVDGSVATRTMPAKAGVAGFGGLGAETLTYGYDSLGLPRTVSGASTYVTTTEYRQDGRLSSVNATDGSGRNILQYWNYEPGTGRLAEHQVLGDFPEVVAADTAYTYDRAGNVTAISDDLAEYGAGQDDTQCYRYDHLRRLTTAWTPNSDDCAANPSPTALGGPAPYQRSYTYTAAGNRSTETEHRTTGNTTRTLAYPAINGDRPHAVSTVTTVTGSASRTDAYSYDEAGNTVRRPGASAEQTLTWDPEGRLARISEATASEEFVYDAEGVRLLQRDGGGKSLYLAGVQYRATGGGAVSGSRFYDHPVAGLVAVRDAAAGLFWQAADHQGSSQFSFKASDLSKQRRRALPFGGDRGSAAAWPHKFGFVGGEKDRAGTVHLGAREYDPSIGRFLSADPILDASDPQSWQGYAYANHTPVTASDPSGLYVCLEACGSADDKINQQNIAKAKAAEKAKKAQREADRKLCPRNIPREDCFGEYKPNPRSIKDKRVYANGTKLVIYHNGAVVINGYVLPPDHPDPYMLAEATDKMVPEGTDGAIGGKGLEDSVQNVVKACASIGNKCSLNFIRAIVKDMMAVKTGALMPSYIGTDAVYREDEPDAPLAGSGDHALAADAQNLTGLDQRDAQRAYHEAGYNTLTQGYEGKEDYEAPPRDPFTDAAKGCVIGAIGFGAGIGIGVGIYQSVRKGEKSDFLTKGKVLKAVGGAGWSGCVTGAIVDGFGI